MASMRETCKLCVGILPMSGGYDGMGCLDTFITTILKPVDNVSSDACAFLSYTHTQTHQPR